MELILDQIKKKSNLVKIIWPIFYDQKFGTRKDWPFYSQLWPDVLQTFGFQLNQLNSENKLFCMSVILQAINTSLSSDNWVLWLYTNICVSGLEVIFLSIATSLN